MLRKRARVSSWVLALSIILDATPPQRPKTKATHRNNNATMIENPIIGEKLSLPSLKKERK